MIILQGQFSIISAFSIENSRKKWLSNVQYAVAPHMLRQTFRHMFGTHVWDTCLGAFWSHYPDLISAVVLAWYMAFAVDCRGVLAVSRPVVSHTDMSPDLLRSVRSQWKNLHFLLKNPDFLIRNPDFLLNNG